MQNARKNLIRPVKIGDVELPNNIVYSPLAGCSDLPFRKIARKYHDGLIFCEMVKMDALYRGEKNTFHLLDYTKDMHPIGAQLCGSKPKLAKKCAKIIEDLGFDVLDLNCGCPVDKVTKDGSGSGLLKTPKLIGEIVSELTAAVKIPVTVKIRAGWDETSINAAENLLIAHEAGAKAVFLHGRTRAQAYKGPANRSYIKNACLQKPEGLLVFGNGDIFSPESAEDMFDSTFCDGILVSRGTMGKPWIGKEIESFFTKELVQTPHPKELLLDHIEIIKHYSIGRKAVTDTRRVACWYLKNTFQVKPLREQINRAKTLEEIESAIENYHWSEKELLPTAP